MIISNYIFQGKKVDSLMKQNYIRERLLTRLHQNACQNGSKCIQNNTNKMHFKCQKLHFAISNLLLIQKNRTTLFLDSDFTLLSDAAPQQRLAALFAGWTIQPTRWFIRLTRLKNIDCGEVFPVEMGLIGAKLHTRNQLLCLK